MSQAFTIVDFRIERQSSTVPVNYEVKLIFKDKNPLYWGNVIANISGDKWLITKSGAKYVIVMNLEKDTEIRSMIGQWEMKEQYKTIG